jgi:hypothetical protein
MVATRGQSAATKPPSPKIKKLKKAAERTYQQHVFNDLLLRCNLNGGQLKYGDVKAIVTEYNKKGFTSVSTRNL